MALCEHACCVFDFTANVDDYDLLELKHILLEHCKSWTFQKEKGATGYIHWQGRVSLKLKTRTPYKTFNTDKIHFSLTSTENKDNNFYVIKSPTKIEGPWSDKDPKDIYIPRQIRNIILRAWQQYIVDDAGVWNTRNINLVIDGNGNHGKSILKTYIGVHGFGRALPFTNDYKDMMRMVMDTPKKQLYIIDIPRALRKDQLRQFFSGIETLKDGYAYDDRYHFKEEYFDCPNIWIFMNTVPDLSMLSTDRWELWTFNALGTLDSLSRNDALKLAVKDL